jgi:D-alanine-D-alanine ligase
VKLIVIFGGVSAEHEVSLASAASVLTHSMMLGWDVLPVGVSKTGDWLVGPGALPSLIEAADVSLLPRGLDVDAFGRAVEIFDGPPPVERMSGWGLALPLCHGRWGEDGTLQGLLVSYGLRVVGCPVAASAVCFDKHLTRSVLSAVGLPVTAGLRIRKQHTTWTLKG